MYERSRRRRRFLESLESRLVLAGEPILSDYVDIETVVFGPTYTTPDSPNNHVVAPSTAHAGIVRLDITVPQGTALCTGTLLPNRSHVLTAAHCVDLAISPSAVDALFELPGGPEQRTSSDIFIHPSYNGDLSNGFDIAVVELSSIAPITASLFDIYRGANEIDTVGGKFGYGISGQGIEDPLNFPAGTKRNGENRYEIFLDADFDILMYDFDSGSPSNNTIALIGGSSDLGEGNDEVMTAPGDSGGPTFKNNLIAGVTSFRATAGTGDSVSGLNSSFGELGGDTRVSMFASWIDLVIDITPSTPDLSASSDTGVSNTDNITNDSTPTFIGTAEAGSTVTIFANGVAVGSGVATGGTYIITTSTLSNGSKSITARSTDISGNQSSLSGSLSVTIDTVAPAAPSLPDLRSTSDSGVSNTDNLTNDSTPTFDFTAEAGGRAYIFAGGLVSGPEFGIGSQYSVTTSPLSDGFKNMRALVEDAAGNFSPLSNVMFIMVDTVAPSVQGVIVANATKDFSVPAGSGVQLIRAPVQDPTKLKILFDQDLADSFAPSTLPDLVVGDMEIVDGGGFGAARGISGVTYDSASKTATWTLTSALLGRDQFRMKVFDGVTDIAGNALDGEWTNPGTTGDTGTSTYPSGNGVAGANLEFRLTLMPGDAVGAADNIINSDDLNAVQNNFGASGPNQTGDADFDDDVDIDDLNLVRNNFGANLTTWPGGGGFAATKGSNKPAPVGEEAMKGALRDEFDRTIAIGKPSAYVGLFGWDKLGDATWWDGVLGAGWSEKLTAAVAPASDGRATEDVAATKLPATIEPFAPRVATPAPAIQDAAATGAVLEQTEILHGSVLIADNVEPPAESRHQNPLVRRSSRGHEVHARRLPEWDEALLAFDDSTTSDPSQR